jgi:hypothetical protein
MPRSPHQRQKQFFCEVHGAHSLCTFPNVSLSLTPAWHYKATQPTFSSLLDYNKHACGLLKRHFDTTVWPIALVHPPNLNIPNSVMGRWRGRLYATDRARDFDHERVMAFTPVIDI